MKKFAFAAILAVVSICFAATAFAGNLAPGAKTTCNDAKSITLEAVGTSSAGDRDNANAVIWKSSNATTIPITLGGDDQGLPGGAFGNHKDSAKWMASAVNMGNKHEKGASKVVLTGQSNFSRGDSIGDISGEVRITNTGTISINVTCG